MIGNWILGLAWMHVLNTSVVEGLNPLTEEIAGPTPPTTNRLLLEDGYRVLLENGDFLELEGV